MECTVDRAGKRLGMLYRIRGSLTIYCADLRRVGRIFRLGGGCVWAVKIQTCRGSGGMLLPENFRNFGLRWTTFRAFS